MRKSALEYLTKKGSITLADKGGRFDLIRFVGIDLGTSKEFKDRYKMFSPSNSMVSIDSVYEALSLIAINDIKDINGAILDIDSGRRHI